MRMRILLAAISFVSAVSGTGCLPTNHLGGVSSLTTTGDTTSGTTSNTSNVDGALLPCTFYDVGSSTRGICVSCFRTLLTAQCPGKASLDACADTTISRNQAYIPMVNQCISQTVTAGFTCNRTCTSGQVIMPGTCTCAVPSPIPTAIGSIQYVDSGQTNFGPPIVGADSKIGEDLGAPVNVTSAAPPCAGTLNLKLGVMNRGDTVFRLNTYSTVQVTSPQNGETTPPFQNYIGTVSNPAPLSMEQMASTPGANAGASLSFRTGGKTEVVNAKGIISTYVRTLSGAASDGLTFGGDDEDLTDAVEPLAADATWTAPGFGAVDAVGNMYVSDPLSHVVRVICYTPTVGHPHCPNTVARGLIKRLAGLNGQPGLSANGGVARNEKLNSPHGIAVNLGYDVFIADSGNHVIQYVCGDETANSRCGAGETGHIKRDPGAGTAPVSGADIPHLNFPMGIDVRMSGKLANVFVADYLNHGIRVYCMFADTRYCAAGDNRLHWIQGTGAAGYTSDRMLTNTSADLGGDAGMLPLFNPTDVKITWYGNLVFTDYGNHLVRAICANNSDVCSTRTTATIPWLYTLAGKMGGTLATPTPAPGYGGVGAAGNTAILTYPFSLAIAKIGSGLGSGAAISSMTNSGVAPPASWDNNVLFTERLLAPGMMPVQSAPAAISGLTGLASPRPLHMGTLHSCGLLGSGNVSCLGNNSVYQTGSSATTDQQSVPATVLGATNGTVIGGGSQHTCIVQGTSSILCWGRGDSGQLGNGTSSTATPGLVAIDDMAVNLDSVSAIAGGDSHTCVMYKDGGTDRVGCWGGNASGQRGTGDRVDSTIINEAANLGSAPLFSQDALAAGTNHTCIVGTDNNVYCWGYHGQGQLGIGGAKTSRTNGNTAAIGGMTGVAAAGNHTCSWNAGNLVRCWGSNDFGESANSTLKTDVLASPAIDLGKPVVRMALGTHHSCALLTVNPTTTSVRCWGDNRFGQLGNDEMVHSTTPVTIPGLPQKVDTISANGDQSCAVAGGKAYCWGANQAAQLGNANSGISSTGNTLRMICGNNPVGGSQGYCKRAIPSAVSGRVLTVAGSPGRSALHNEGEGGLAAGLGFAKLYGLTYDGYKNIVFSSQGFTDRSGTAHADYSLRMILGEATSAISTVKFAFTDSNTLSSYYCLRVKAFTACDPGGVCSCRLSQPVDDPDTRFWMAVTQNDICPP
jgi:alpha-tubulin suppressor-like RCC1 family protein